ncbi:Uncharacterized protein FWK35_00021819, partial [Aphis craccivora]
DIASAISLRSVSLKAYRFLLKKNFPLPALPSLRRWASTFNVNHRILFDVLKLMKSKGEEMTDIEKYSVVAFDETYVSK